MKSFLRSTLVAGVTVGGVVLLLVLAGWLYSRYRYPYGSSHCCLHALGMSLMAYAQSNGGRYPAGESCPEASLGLVSREPYRVGADTLRGKTVPIEIVQRILERGDLLGPDSCGWHYVEGLTVADDPNLALIWDKVGLGHNGEDIGGGHSVFLLDGQEQIISAAEWPAFLKQQEKLMAARRGRSEKSLNVP
jgi:hypothetical protein